MRNIYLLQRLKLKSDDYQSATHLFIPNGSDIDKLQNRIKLMFEFDYMGMSEFECGTCPCAIKNIAASGDSLAVFKTSILAKDGRRLCVIGGNADLAIKFVEDIVSKELAGISTRLPEPTYLKENITSKSRYGDNTIPAFSSYKKVDAWLCIDNGIEFIAVLGEKVALKVFQLLLAI